MQPALLRKKYQARGDILLTLLRFSFFLSEENEEMGERVERTTTPAFLHHPSFLPPGDKKVQREGEEEEGGQGKAWKGGERKKKEGEMELEKRRGIEGKNHVATKLHLSLPHTSQKHQKYGGSGGGDRDGRTGGRIDI